MLSSVVHAVMEEIEDLREHHANAVASQTEQVSLLEDRIGRAIEGSVAQLTERWSAAAKDLNERLIALDGKVLSELEGVSEALQAKIRVAVDDMEACVGALDARVLSELEANVTTTVEDVGEVGDKLGKRIDELQATVKTHVERLEAAIAQLALIGDKAGKLEGYGERRGE
jgi:endonuclease III